MTKSHQFWKQTLEISSAHVHSPSTYRSGGNHGAQLTFSLLHVCCSDQACLDSDSSSSSAICAQTSCCEERKEQDRASVLQRLDLLLQAPQPFFSSQHQHFTFHTCSSADKQDAPQDCCLFLPLVLLLSMLSNQCAQAARSEGALAARGHLK